MQSEKAARSDPVGKEQTQLLTLKPYRLLRRGSGRFALLPIALACLTLLVRLEPLSSPMLLYDELTSYLFATGRYSEYLELARRVDLPAAKWVTAAEWQRYLQVGSDSSPTTVVNHLLRHDIHPPFYFLLLHQWMKLVGSSYLSGRLLSWLLDFGTFVLVILLGQVLYSDKRFGWLAGLVCLLSPMAIMGAATIRQYSLLTFLATLYTLLLAQILFVSQSHDRKSATLVVLASVGIAGLLTHFAFALVICGALVAALIYGNGHHRLRYFALLAFPIPPIILFVVSYPQALGIRSFLRKPLSIDVFVQAHALHFARQSLELLLPLILAVAVTIALHMMAWIQQRSPELDWEEQSRTALGFTFTMLLVPYVLYSWFYLFGLFTSHARMARHLLYLTPFVTMFATIWLQILSRTLIGRMLTRALLLSLLVIAIIERGQVLLDRRHLDMAILADYELLVVDSIERPETFIYMRPGSKVLAATQSDLISEPNDWLPRLIEEGGAYVSLYRPGKPEHEDAAGQSKILDLMADSGRYRLASRGVDRWNVISIYEVGP